MRRGLFAALTLLGVGACSVGPSYVRPEVAAPPSYDGVASPAAAPGASQATQEPISATWWTTFADPELTALVERARAANLDVLQAESRVREARSARRIAAAEFFPKIDAAGSYERQHAPLHGVTEGSRRAGHWFDLFTVGFDANWEIDVFGGTRRSVEAADATLESFEADREAVLVSLFGEVGREYVTYRSLQARIELAQRNLETQKNTLELTKRLFDSGLAPELDVTRAAAQVATTAASIPVLQLEEAQSLHRLGVLVGQPPLALRDELAPVAPIPEAPPAVSVGLPSDLLLRRPDVARSERLLAAATADIGVAEADLFPRFFLSGVGGLQSLRTSDLFDWHSLLVDVGPSIRWPVFQGGAIRANVALKTDAQRELAAAYQETVLQAFEDVEDSLVAFARQQEARAQLEDAVRADDRAAQLARQLYTQGLTDFLNVLVAEETLFTAQDALAQSQRDVAIDLVALYKAVGGGWETAGPVSAATP